MPVPKGKNSKQRRDNRAANKGLKPKAVAICQTCSSPLATHQVCNECGYYKGQKVLRTKNDRMHERGKIRKEKEERMKANAPEAAPEVAAEVPVEETKS
jgi:large subunit ribosomal protein L32